MSLQSEKQKIWRKLSKKRILDSMGGCCQICGYNKCPDALDLHHIDPLKKEINFAKQIGNTNNWEKLKKELEFCILLCSNCHREFHAGYTNLPTKYEKFRDVEMERAGFDLCPVCKENLKPIIFSTCSKQCGVVNRGKFDWNSIDILEIIKYYKNITEAAESLGVSRRALSKRLNKIKNLL